MKKFFFPVFCIASIMLTASGVLAREEEAPAEEEAPPEEAPPEEGPAEEALPEEAVSEEETPPEEDPAEEALPEEAPAEEIEPEEEPAAETPPPEPEEDVGIGHMDFAISGGVNFLLSAGSFNSFDVRRANTGSTVNAEFDDAFYAGAIHFHLRYRAPELVPLLIQVGYGAMYTPGKGEATAITAPHKREIEYHNLIMEIPIIVGGYWNVFDTGLFLWGALGPTITFYVNSYWDMQGEGLNDLEAPGNVGLYFVFLGIDYYPVDAFGLSLCTAYRYLPGEEMDFREKADQDDRLSGVSMDFSGIELKLEMRVSFF